MRKKIKATLMMVLGTVAWLGQLHTLVLLWGWMWSEPDPARRAKAYFATCATKPGCLKALLRSLRGHATSRPATQKGQRSTRQKPTAYHEAALQQLQKAGKEGRTHRLTHEGLASIARSSATLRRAFYYADAIVICGVPARKDGRPSWMQKRRVHLALTLYRQGLAPWVVFSGSAMHNRHVEAKVMARFARELGIPKQAILLEPWARHTTGNVRYSVIQGLQRGWRRILIVSDWAHTLYVTRFTQHGQYGGPTHTRYFSSIRSVVLDIKGCPQGGDRAPRGSHEAQRGAPSCP